MKVAIDIDGTITEFPALFELLRPNNSIVFLTTKRFGDKERVKQLAGLGIVRGYTIEIVEGDRPNWVAYNKALYCKEKGIELVVENSQLNASYIKEYSPTTKILLLY